MHDFILLCFAGSVGCLLGMFVFKGTPRVDWLLKYHKLILQNNALSREQIRILGYLIEQKKAYIRQSVASLN
jgi:hypothetical protein